MMSSSSSSYITNESRLTYYEFDPNLDFSEMVELGISNELVRDELYLPSHPSRGWIKCYISTTGPGCFRMYLEGSKKNRFLLSAKQLSTTDSILISAYNDFPIIETIPKKGYLARLEKCGDSFLLNLNHCHLCDVRLGCFNCGRGPNEREVIAKVTHYLQKFRPMNVEYRCVKVMIPNISKSGKRKIWCPRALRNSNPTLGNDLNVNEMINLDKKCGYILKSKVPEWNDEAESLVVRFINNRVLYSSSKNFLLTKASEIQEADIKMIKDESEDVSWATIKSSSSASRAKARSMSTESIKSTKSVESQNSEKTNSFIGITSTKKTSKSRTTSFDDKRRPESGTKSRTNSEVFDDLDDHFTVFQFGKSSPTTYSLDFKYPLSPLQAFGIALSAFY